MDFIITHNIAKLARVEKMAFEAVVEQADQLLLDANKIVPESGLDKDTNNGEESLKDSAKVTKFPTQNDVVVSYDTPYAVRQHEDLDLNHPDPRNPKSKSGRKAQWLELTAEKNSTKYIR